MKQKMILISILLGMAGLLAIVSCETTHIHGDGNWPSGALRLNVRDAEGKPIKGATFRIYHAGTRDLALERFHGSQADDKSLISNEDGRIVTFSPLSGYPTGFDSWRLFWLFPIQTGTEGFDCEIRAEGFKPLLFDARLLFDQLYDDYKNFPRTKVKVKGEEFEGYVFEHTFTLER